MTLESAAELITGLSPVGRRILEAATDIVAGGGLAALSVEAVAVEAGVHKSAIGYHFGSKEGLVLALAASLFAESADDVPARLSAIREPAERLAAYLEFLRERSRIRRVWRLAFALWPLTQEDEAFRAKVVELQKDTLRRHMSALGLKEGGAEDLALLTALDASIAGLAFYSSYMGAAMSMDACLDRLEEAFKAVLLEAMEGGLSR